MTKEIKLPKPHDYSRVLLTTMKDEGPYMLEWLAHHFAIGFTHAIIMTNRCADGTDKLARNLEKLGIVTHANNSPPYPKGIQKTAYARMRRFDAFEQAEWLMTLDCDEFLNLSPEFPHLDNLLDYFGDKVYAVSFTWQVFGTNGVKHLIDTPIVEQFTKCADDLQIRPYEIAGLKTIFRNNIFKKAGTHRPRDLDTEAVKNMHWVDADGISMTHIQNVMHWSALENGLGFGRRFGRVHHYALRSKPAFWLKWERGFVNRTEEGLRADKDPRNYFRIFDWNIIKNNSMRAHLSNFQQILEQLKSVNKIEELHAKAFFHHFDRYLNLRDELQADPSLAPIFEEIMNEEPRKDFDNYQAKSYCKQTQNWHVLEETIAYKNARSFYPMGKPE